MVFDFDGLLMDTESVMLASWQHEWRQARRMTATLVTPGGRPIGTI